MRFTVNWTLKWYLKWPAWLFPARSRPWALMSPGNNSKNNSYFNTFGFVDWELQAGIVISCYRKEKCFWFNSLHVSSLSTGENGVVPAAVRRSGSPENATMTPAPEAVSKPPEVPSKGSNGDDPSTVPTQGRSSGKARQTINIKAELEKRQGGKPLLNLVVIGEKEMHT